jgi:chromosome segregation ATPase
MYFSNTFTTKAIMSSTQQVLISKVTAASLPFKMVKAVERRDYAAVCFMLLKEVSDANNHIHHHEVADKHNHALHLRVCQKLKSMKEENKELKAKLEKKEVESKGFEQMLGWYEEDDVHLRKEIQALGEQLESERKQSRVERKHMDRGFEHLEQTHEQELLKLQKESEALRQEVLNLTKKKEDIESCHAELQEKTLKLQRDYETCVGDIFRLQDKKEELRQQLGYTSTELQEGKRTIKQLEEVLEEERTKSAYLEARVQALSVFPKK